MYRSFVSFQVDRSRFPTTGQPPGAELAEWVSKALDGAGLAHEGPNDREGWAWELYRGEGKVTIVSIVGFSEDGPRRETCAGSPGGVRGLAILSVMARLRWSRRLGWWLAAASLFVLASDPGALARVASRDRNPPTFGGLESAITCVPGPVGAGKTTSYRLEWDPATDDVTPSTKIAYDVYQATKAGGEEFSSPTYIVRHGATSFMTPPLPTDTTFYFVVRARDRAGNRDSNEIERQGVNICV